MVKCKVLISVLTIVFCFPMKAFCNNEEALEQNKILINADEKAFELSLVAISAAQKKSVICEPLITNGDVRDSAIFKKLNTLNPSSQDYINELCKIYDYSCTDTPDGILVFKKQYGQGKNVPGISFDEALSSVSKIIEIGKTLPIKKGMNIRKMVEDLINPMSQSERDSLKKGVLVSSLRDDQKKLLHALVTYVQFKEIYVVEELYTRLLGTKKDSAEFSTKNFYGIDYPVYSGKFNMYSPQEISDVVLGKWVSTTITNQTIFDANKDAYIENEKIISKTKDPTTPTPFVNFSEISSSKTFNDYFSISNFDKNNYYLNKSVGKKRLIIIGDQYSDSELMLKNICALLNLKILKINSKTFISNSIDANTNNEGIRYSIFRVLPVGLSESLNFNDLKNKQMSVNLLNLITLNAEKVYGASIKRIRYLVEEKIKKSKDGKIKMLKSSDEIYDLVAVSSFCTLVPILMVITKDYPQYLASEEKFNQSILKINLEEVAKTVVDPHHYQVALSVMSKDAGGFSMQTVLRIKD